MTASSPMKLLATLGSFKLYYARPDVFTHPGLHLWTGSRHRRVLPLPRTGRARW